MAEVESQVRVVVGQDADRAYWQRVRSVLARRQTMALDNRQRFILAIAAALVDIKTAEAGR